MNKMSLDDKFEVGEAGELIKFVVKSTDPKHALSGGSNSNSSTSGGGGGSGGNSSSHFASFVCYAPTAEATAEWVETIQAILQSQRDFLSAIQQPIRYQEAQEKARLSSGGGMTQHL